MKTKSGRLSVHVYLHGELAKRVLPTLEGRPVGFRLILASGIFLASSFSVDSDTSTDREGVVAGVWVVLFHADAFSI